MKIYKIQIFGANLTFSGSSGIYSRFHIGCVFAEYNLLKPKIFIQNFTYI